MRQLTRLALSSLCLLRLRRAEVWKKVEDVLEITENGMVDWELAVEHFLEVGLNVSEAQVETLERLQLGGYAARESADCNVADVAQEVLDSDLFCFFGFDDGWGVDEGFGCGGSVLGHSLALFICRHCGKRSFSNTYILNLLNCKVCVCWYAILLWLNIDNDQ